jgi:hypothetical protein
METQWIGTKNSQIRHRNNAMSTLTIKIGSSVNTSQRYEYFDYWNRVKCNQHLKISPCFGDGKEVAMKQADGFGRRKQIRRGRRQTLGKDEAASTTCPRLGKQTPPTSGTTRLEEEVNDEQQHPCVGETEEEQPPRAMWSPYMMPLPPCTAGRGFRVWPHRGEWRAGGSEERRGEDKEWVAPLIIREANPSSGEEEEILP